MEGQAENAAGSARAGGLEFDAFRIEPATRRLTRDGEEVPLTSRAFDLLLILVENAGRPLAKQSVMRAVWPDRYVSENNLAQQIAVVRRALGDPSSGGRFVATIPGVGYQFVAAVRAVDAAPPDPDTRAVTSLVVFPFAQSGSAGHTYLAHWLLDALVTDLGRVRGLYVRPAEAGPASGESPIEAGLRFGVDAVLTGSVERRGDRVRVSARLERTRDALVLWSGTLDEAMPDVFALQEALAEWVARAVRRDLSLADLAALRERRTEQPEARRLYDAGRLLWDKRTVHGLERSLDCFERAVAADPSFAAAHVGIADALAVLAYFQLGADSAEARYRRAVEAALRAIELDPSLAEAHATLGLLRLDFERDWDGGRRSLGRAIELKPGYAMAYFWYGRYLLIVGDEVGAEASIRRAVDLDPRSSSTLLGLGGLYLLLRRYDEALGLFARASEMEPDNAWSALLAGRALEQTERPDEAEVRFRRASELSGGYSAAAASLAHLEATRGRREAAFEAARGAQGPASDFAWCLVYVGLGEVERALDLLAAAVASRSLAVPDLLYDARLDALRDDERYGAVVRSLGLEPR